MEFTEWFEEHLSVGAYPLFTDNGMVDYNSYDIIINVSDEFYPEIDARLMSEFGCVTHWFPMNETGADNGLNSIYGACYVMRIAEERGLRVYLHCHAGVYRSRIVHAAYHFMRTGRHVKRPFGNYQTALHYTCNVGYLPEIEQTEAFLLKINNAAPRLKNWMVGGTLDEIKLECVTSYRVDEKPH